MKTLQGSEVRGQGSGNRGALDSRLSTLRHPRGFTLVEMLVVITIIGLLAALLTAAAWRAFVTAKNALIVAEIAKLDLAIQSFKENFGDYPPENQAAVTPFLNRAFPRYLGTFPGSGLTPETALVYWLSGPTGKGFSANKADPFDTGSTRIGPFYNFDATRVKDGKYYPPGVTGGAPYVYFRASVGANGKPKYSGTSTCGAKPYKKSPATATDPPPVNPNTYQILCAGRDGTYGAGIDFPTGSDYDNANYDDISNFSKGTMEQAMP